MRHWARRARTGAAVVAVLLAAAVVIVSLVPSASMDERRPTTANGPAPSNRPTSGDVRRWAPRSGTTWQWQLTTPVDLSVEAEVFDIDGFTNGADVVRALHERGRRVICYIEVGTAAVFRPDFRRWPDGVLGRRTRWPGERWVDIRRLDVIAGLLADRFDMCRAKGFDAVEPDVMDHYLHETGFPITAGDQLRFNRFVARLAHERGLSVGLKNDVDQAATLVGVFDFAVNEECLAFDECDALIPFIAAGKAVLHAEYDADRFPTCAAAPSGFSSIRKRRSLNAARWPC